MKGTGRWKALQVVKVVTLHGVMVEAVLAASKKSMRAKAPSTEPGSRQGCQRFGCAAHGGEESSPSYDAVQPTEAGLGVVKRSALPPYRAKVRW